METFHLFHLAASWDGIDNSVKPVAPPLAASPVHPDMSQPSSTQDLLPGLSSSIGEELASKPKIKAAAAQMVFASRSSQDFITPGQVTESEKWCAEGVLEALRGFNIDPDVHTSLVSEPLAETDFLIIIVVTPRSWQRLGIEVIQRPRDGTKLLSIIMCETCDVASM